MSIFSVIHKKQKQKFVIKLPHYQNFMENDDNDSFEFYSYDDSLESNSENDSQFYGLDFGDSEAVVINSSTSESSDTGTESEYYESSSDAELDEINSYSSSSSSSNNEASDSPPSSNQSEDSSVIQIMDRDAIVLSDNPEENEPHLINNVESNSGPPQVQENVTIPNELTNEVISVSAAETSNLITAPSTGTISTPKNKRRNSSNSSQPSNKKSKCLSQSSQDDSDGCPICFEPWAHSGKHRLSSLKCGHLFGQSCITRWIKQGEKKCPQCNAKARASDIRVLYAKKLTAIDNTELENALQMLETEKKDRREKEMQLAQVRMQYQMAKAECSRIRTELEELKRLHARSNLPKHIQSQIKEGNQSNGSQYNLKKCFTVSATGNCRVMDYCENSYTIAISQPSPHNSFMTGFGIKRFSMADLKSNTFIFLHGKQIKDVKFRPGVDDWVMTASQDLTIKITNLNSKSVLHTFPLDKPVWSCCWDTSNSNYLYAGLSNGAMSLYDVRRTSEAVGVFKHQNYSCPIVSMDHIPSKSIGATSTENGGLLVSTLKGVAFWRIASESNFELTPNLLPVANGSCAGLQYSNYLNQILVTFRPGKSPGSTSNHILYNVNLFPKTNDDGSLEPMCHYQYTFPGGRTHTMLNRNALYNIGEENFIAFGNEERNTVVVYETKTKKMRQSVKCDGPSLDILSLKQANDHFLATLTDKNLRIYDYE